MRTCKRLLFSLLLILWALPVWAGDQATSGVTAQTIIDQAQIYLDDINESFWDEDDQLLKFLNDGLVDIAALSQCLQSTETITLATGVTVYDLTANYITVKGVIYNGGGTTYNKPLEEGDLFSGGEDGKGVGMPEDPGEPVYWDEWGGYVYIWPIQTSGVSGYRATVHIVTLPTDVTLTDAIGLPAIYDRALVYYIVSEALLRASLFDLSDKYRERYMEEMLRFRQDLNEGVQAKKEIAQ